MLIFTVKIGHELTEQSLPKLRVYNHMHTNLGRGKSELQRTRCQVTPGECELMTSATENRPPFYGKGETAR